MYIYKNCGGGRVRHFSYNRGREETEYARCLFVLGTFGAGCRSLFQGISIWLCLWSLYTTIYLI